MADPAGELLQPDDSPLLLKEKRSKSMDARVRNDPEGASSSPDPEPSDQKRWSLELRPPKSPSFSALRPKSAGFRRKKSAKVLSESKKVAVPDLRRNSISGDLTNIALKKGAEMKELLRNSFRIRGGRPKGSGNTKRKTERKRCNSEGSGTEDNVTRWLNDCSRHSLTMETVSETEALSGSFSPRPYIDDRASEPVHGGNFDDDNNVDDDEIEIDGITEAADLEDIAIALNMSAHLPPARASQVVQNAKKHTQLKINLSPPLSPKSAPISPTTGVSNSPTFLQRASVLLTPRNSLVLSQPADMETSGGSAPTPPSSPKTPTNETPVLLQPPPSPKMKQLQLPNPAIVQTPPSPVPSTTSSEAANPNPAVTSGQSTSSNGIIANVASPSSPGTTEQTSLQRKSSFSSSPLEQRMQTTTLASVGERRSSATGLYPSPPSTPVHQTISSTCETIISKASIKIVHPTNVDIPPKEHRLDKTASAISGNTRNVQVDDECDMFDCGICTEPMVIPKSLPCLHNFCLQCLEKYFCTNNILDGAEFLCPTCRAVATVPLDGGAVRFPTNFHIEKLRNKQKQKNRDVERIIKEALNYLEEKEIDIIDKLSERKRTSLANIGNHRELFVNAIDKYIEAMQITIEDVYAKDSTYIAKTISTMKVKLAKLHKNLKKFDNKECDEVQELRFQGEIITNLANELEQIKAQVNGEISKVLKYKTKFEMGNSAGLRWSQEFGKLNRVEMDKDGNEIKLYGNEGSILLSFLPHWMVNGGMLILGLLPLVIFCFIMRSILNIASEV